MTVNDAASDWQRPDYSEPGGRPLLFYAVFGKFPAEIRLSRRRYLCEGIPEGIEPTRLGREAAAEHFLEGPAWEMLERSQPELAKAIREAPECILLRGELDDQESLEYFRDVAGFAAYLAENGGVCVWDLQMLRWWEPERWTKAVLERDEEWPCRHVMILVSEEEDGDGRWYHTRGMRKFGRPDLSMHHVPADLERAVTAMFNRFILLQARGGIVPEGQEVRMATLPPGIRCHHGGDLEDWDFNNVHVEMRWPGK